MIRENWALPAKMEFGIYYPELEIDQVQYQLMTTPWQLAEKSEVLETVFEHIHPVRAFFGKKPNILEQITGHALSRSQKHWAMQASLPSQAVEYKRGIPALFHSYDVQKNYADVLESAKQPMNKITEFVEYIPTTTYHLTDEKFWKSFKNEEVGKIHQAIQNVEIRARKITTTIDVPQEDQDMFDVMIGFLASKGDAVLIKEDRPNNEVLCYQL